MIKRHRNGLRQFPIVSSGATCGTSTFFRFAFSPAPVRVCRLPRAEFERPQAASAAEASAPALGAMTSVAARRNGNGRGAAPDYDDSTDNESRSRSDNVRPLRCSRGPSTRSGHGQGTVGGVNRSPVSVT